MTTEHLPLFTSEQDEQNVAIIAELTQRCCDRDEEITRLKALCREPVVLPLAELKKLRRFNYKFVTNGGKGDVNDAGISIYFEISEAINKKLGERA